MFMQTLMKSIGEIWRCANLYRMKAYEPLNINSFQDTYLLQICKNPGITQDQLSKIIYVHKSNVARQVASLEEKGLVYRLTHQEDKRILQVYPTKKALDLMPLIMKMNQQWNQLLMNELPLDDQQKFLEILSFLASKAKEAVDCLEEKE